VDDVDDDGSGEQSRYRDSLECADFTEKLCRFERLTSATAAGHRDHGRPSSRPSSAPLSSTAWRGAPVDRLRHSVSSDSAPVVTVTFPASTSSRGWTRRGHRVGVVETPTGDVDLSPSSASPTDDVIISPSSVQAWRPREDPLSPLQKKSSLQHSAPRRHTTSTGRDRQSDVRAAILASAAAKLASASERVASNSTSPDRTRVVKSSPASSSGSEGPRTPDHSFKCKLSAGLENGADTCSDDSSQLLNEQSSESARSSSSGRTEDSPTAQKPPTGRISVESARLTKQTDRRNFDKASSFFRSLLSRSRSPSPNRTDVVSGPSTGKSARPNDLAVNGFQDQHSARANGKTADTLASPQSSAGSFPITPTESSSACKSLRSSESYELSTSGGRDLLYTANNLKSSSESSKSVDSTSSDSGGEKTCDTVTTSIVIGDIGRNCAHVESVSSSNHSEFEGDKLNSSNQRLRSTAEIVVNSAADNKPEVKRSEQQQASVDASPTQSTRVRKVVTFAEEGNSSISSVPLGSRGTVNSEMQAEADMSSNNNPLLVSRLTAREVVNSVNENHSTSRSDITFDVSNANMQLNNDVASSNDIVSNASKSAVIMNGHEPGDLLGMEADDTASISDVESEDMSASQQDLRIQYQQRRAERLQEQKAAELEKQRLEEILKLCTEFGLSTDISSSLLVSDNSSNVAAEKAERQNSSVGRIKTNGSLSKLGGVPSTEVERRLNQSGSASNSDDDIDRGTIRRRPVTTKSSVDSASTSTLKTALPATTASDVDKISRTALARTASGTLPTVGLSVEAAGRSKSVPVIDATLLDGDLDRLLQSNIDFSLPTAADWRVGQTNHAGILKSSLDWYSASLPEYSSIWDSVNTWKSSQHRVSNFLL